MAWYRTGTVTVTNNSTAVVGTGTAWVTAVAVGETFVGPDGQVYEVVAINSANSLTVAPAYKGATAAGQSYAIMPSQSYLRDLAIAAAALVEGYSSVKNNAGTGKFAAGTSASPSLRNTADENTGLNLLGNDMLALVTAGVERLKLDASGVPSGSTAEYLMDRSHHTGAQAITTIDGLQAALNAKETPAGALAQMQGFGLGAASGATTVVSDPDVVTASGMYRVTSSVLKMPLAGIGWTLLHKQYSSSQKSQLATSISGSTIGRVFVRAMAASVWSAWREIGFLDSPEFTGAPVAPNMRLTNVASTNSNTLDFYEEGTFTPTLLGATGVGTNTYNINTGQYTRIGDRVLWTAFIQLSSSSGMTGQLRMAGLPFNVINNSVARGAVTIGYYAGMSDTAAYDFRAFHNQNAATVDLLKRSVGQVTSGAFPATEVTGTAQIYLSGNYKAA